MFRHFIMILVLAIVLIVSSVNYVHCGSMSTVSVDSYPDGWCDPHQGTVTRTTGECVCKNECEGLGCQRAQGIIWFAYASCPSCKCVGFASKGNKTKSKTNGNIYESNYV